MTNLNLHKDLSCTALKTILKWYDGQLKTADQLLWVLGLCSHALGCSQAIAYHEETPSARRNARDGPGPILLAHALDSTNRLKLWLVVSQFEVALKHLIL